MAKEERGEEEVARLSLPRRRLRLRIHARPEPQIRIQRVIRDSELAAGPALVVARSARAPAARSGSPTPASYPSRAATAAAPRRSRRAAPAADRPARGNCRAGERDGPLDDALELAHVARPVVRQQRVGRRGRQLQRPQRPMPLEEVPRQLQDVVAPRAAAAAPGRRRRSAGRTDPAGTGCCSTSSDSGRFVATMMRVSTRRAPQPPTRSTERSWIARSSLACAAGDRSDTSSRNSVPFVRVLELAAAAAHAGRRAILDAEQLRFEQRLDNRRAVDRDERPLAPAAQLVNLPRDELLAGARFALDRGS